MPQYLSPGINQVSHFEGGTGTALGSPVPLSPRLARTSRVVMDLGNPELAAGTDCGALSASLGSYKTSL
ncbi:hypothetical protein PoB_004974500 [Plakobranchus ocellatus]|uniref:Uncharacterized protein n=1 Tax=Plakobranchus ocellatus TaxID=259542 RepID=A0AAV4BV96_9GAST|nr:hypothetical protein PoB_004974500 [Plakobranchus ocellatus]